MNPELSLRGKLVATAAVIGGLLVSGCGNNTEANNDQAAQSVDPIAASLNQYRNDVYYNRHARVVLNVCAGWRNVSGGITVVENPGVASAETNDGKYSYLVFSAPSSDKKPPLLQQMNGPQVLVDSHNRVFGGGPSGVKLDKELEKSHSYYAYATERALSQKPDKAENGQIYFQDAQTGVPLMNSIFTGGPFSDKRILDVCHALGKDDPVPSLDLTISPR